MYTKSEVMDKKYTIYHAFFSATRIIRSKGYAKEGICINAIAGRDDSEKITLKELNELVERMVNDTLDRL